MENMNLSDKSKEVLESGTWQELREDMKEKIVREYLKNGYADGEKQHDISVSEITYKVLERGEVTTFYDSCGNTLFNVGNEELRTKYEEAVGNGSEPDVEGKKKGDDAHEAKEKLEKELQEEKDKTFAEPVIGYLIKRCEEDEGLAQDVVQEHKTWKKCFDYIFKQAKKQAKGGRGIAIRDDMVYEWAEDYYHKDDKAEEEKKAKQVTEAKARQKKATANRKNSKKKQLASQEAGTYAKKEKAENKSVKEQVKPKKNGKELEGQMDLFSMMGM